MLLNQFLKKDIVNLNFFDILIIIVIIIFLVFISKFFLNKKIFANKLFSIINNTLSISLISLFCVILISFLHFIYPRIIEPIIDTEISNSKILFSSIFSDSKPLKFSLSIQIKPKHWRKIVKNTIENKNKILNTEKNWYPVAINSSNEKFTGKIRVRGDTWPHFRNEKKSWRIKFDSEKLFRGMRILDIIIPSDKEYANEIIALKLAEENGLTVPKFKEFINVSINGVDNGIYYAVEANSKEMIEKLDLPVGEIFSQSDLWLQNFINGEGLSIRSFDNNPGSYKATISKNNSKIDIENFNRFKEFLEIQKVKEPDTFKELIYEYLDVEKFIKWNAITWLFGSDERWGVHSHVSSNLRWYLNTTNGKFEPLLYDVIIAKIDQTQFQKDNFVLGINNGSFEFQEFNEFIKRVMQIKEINYLRNKFLWNLLNHHNSSFNYINLYKDAYFDIRPHLLKGIGSKVPFPTFRLLDERFNRNYDFLKHNKDFIFDRLNFNRVVLSKNYKYEDSMSQIAIDLVPDSLSRLSIENISLDSSLVPEIKTIIFNNKNITTNSILTKKNGRLHISSKDLIMQSNLDNNLNPVLTKFNIQIFFKNKISNEKDLNELVKLKFKNLVTNNLIDKKNIFSTPNLYEEKSISKKNNIKNIDELNKKYNINFKLIEENTITLEPGNHLINETIIIPKKYSLILKGGTNLFLGDDVSIILHNAVQIIGNKNNKVKINSIDPNKPFGSFLVIDAKKNSFVDYLEISNGGESRHNGVYATGQIAFHNSNVSISNSKFSLATGDDSLNIKNANISIEKSFFYNNISDAFDGDDVEGVLKNNNFINNLGDAIDISASDLLSFSNSILNTGDKGISVGEKSNIILVNNFIKKSSIGIASKDNSHVIITNSLLIDNEIPISAYQKKQIFEFGGYVELYNSILINNKKHINLDNLSRLQVSNIIVDEDIQIEKILTKNFNSNIKKRLSLNNIFVLSQSDRLKFFLDSNFILAEEFNHYEKFDFKIPKYFDFAKFEFSNKYIGLFKNLENYE